MNWNLCGAGRRGSRCALALFLAFRFSCLEVQHPALRVPPGGNQVDGLPPASVTEKCEKLSDCFHFCHEFT